MNKKIENNQKNQRIQVFARCRPLNSIEKKQYSPSVVEVIPDKKIVVKDRNVNREFLFDKVFPPDTKQISVYKSVVGPLIQEVLMGYNCTVFAYGQTGTGKTYTMEGERNDSKCSWEDDPGAGIIPRSLHQLFEDLNKEDNVEFSVRVSFLELYNEELFDLLSSTELSRLRLFEDSSKKGSVIIQGLEEIMVNTKDEVYSILERGTARRQTAATMLNATSSRSHTVFSVTVHIKENTVEGEELLKTGKLNLVDLAGSENVGRSGAVDKRAREAGSINQSLLTLGRVITALIEKQPHVPYRESKLTRLLQDSLGGHTKTSIIATISPALCNFDETISTLDYATKAKSITIKPEVNQKMTKRALIREYTEEIERLRKDLVALRSKEGFYIDMDNYTGIINEIEEKKDLIKDMTDKIELLKEENAKIEDMFRITKEELHITSEKLNQTSKKYEETAEKLTSTTNALSHTQKVLYDTTIDRNEKQYLITVQTNTEKKLSEQAQKLLCVAEETTEDVNKLHAKIDRKVAVEKTNEEKCKEFRQMYQEQFAMLDELVSHSEKQQIVNLTKTQNDIDKLSQIVQNYQSQVTSYLSQFVDLITNKTGDLFSAVSSGGVSQMEWSNSLIEQINHKKEVLSTKQHSILLERLPLFVHDMNLKNSEMKEWICNIHKQLSEKIENEKKKLFKESENRKMLQSSLKQSVEALCRNYEDILKDFKERSSNVHDLEDKFEKEFCEKLNDLEGMVKAFKELSQCHKETRKNASKCEDVLTTSLENNTLKLQELHQPLSNIWDSELHIEEGNRALGEMLNVINIQKFSEKQQSLIESQTKALTEFETYTKDNAKEEEIIFIETETAVRNQIKVVSENTLNLEKDITDIKGSLEDYTQSGKKLIGENITNIHNAIQKTTSNITDCKDVLQGVASQLKEEILKRDIEFEKFVSEDLQKDIPTGTTPQRRNYVYPKLLAATSPHDRILQRYRLKSETDIERAVSVPLESSFNESEECTEYIDKNIVSTNLLIESFSSDESTSYDTDASSVSNASIESGKNKENKKNLKKRSRLPKRMAVNSFIKPAPPSSRKPLMVTNIEVNEQCDA